MEMRNMYEMCFTKTILFHCIDLDCIFPYSLSFSLSLSMTMCHCTAQVNRVGSKVRYMRKLKASSPHFIKRNEYSCRQTICPMRLFCYQCVAWVYSFLFLCLSHSQSLSLCFLFINETHSMLNWWMTHFYADSKCWMHSNWCGERERGECEKM